MDLEVAPSRIPAPRTVPGGVHFQLFAPRAGGPVRWRLLSGNNRDLGRSGDYFLDGDACLAAIDEFLSMLSDLQAAVKPIPKNQWGWALSEARGRVLAVNGHPYDRQIRCEQGLALFIRVAPTASISAAIAVSRARRWS